MVVQIGNTGFNAEALADWTREQFMKKFGHLPSMNEAWIQIQKHNKSSKKAAASNSSVRRNGKK